MILSELLNILLHIQEKDIPSHTKEFEFLGQYLKHALFQVDVAYILKDVRSVGCNYK